MIRLVEEEEEEDLRVAQEVGEELRVEQGEEGGHREEEGGHPEEGEGHQVGEEGRQVEGEEAEERLVGQVEVEEHH